MKIEREETEETEIKNLISGVAAFSP